MTEFQQGSDFSISLLFTTASNSAIDITDCNARAMLKAKISDPDSAAYVDINNSASAIFFDLTHSTSGRMVVTVPGSATSRIEICKSMTVYAQVFTEVGEHTYRSANIPIILVESLIKSGF